MANEKNLIPLNKRPQRERKEIARMGAQAANKKKKEQKTYAEMAKAMLSAKIVDKDLIADLKAFGIEDTDVKAYTLLGMIRASGCGSYQAFDRLMELLGEKTESISETEEKQTNLLGAIEKAVKNAD